MTTTIYHLVDPRDKTVRYIGKSKKPTARLRQHIRESQQRQNTRKKQWIHELQQQGLSPVLISASRHSCEKFARLAESREVHKHRKTIYNIHDPAVGARDLHKQPE